jgi:GntR family transcriptional regulator
MGLLRSSRGWERRSSRHGRPIARRRHWSYDGRIAATGDSTDAGLERLDTRSLSGRVREELLKAIHSGRFPDDRLPPEAELAVQLGVSRTTIRAALQSLSDDGIVSRRRRHGTLVNRHVLRSTMGLNRLVSFRALIEQSQIHRAQDADADAAAALGLEPGTPCLIVKRLLRANGDPVIHITDTVPLDRLPADLGDIVDADSTFDFLAANDVGQVDHVRAELVPRVADRAQPRELDIAPGTAYIELREVLFTRDHERIAFSRIAVDDALVRLSLVRRDL